MHLVEIKKENVSSNKLETLLISDKDGSRESLIILMLRDKKAKNTNTRRCAVLRFERANFRLFKFKITCAVMQTKFAISEKSDRKKANGRKFKEI